MSADKYSSIFSRQMEAIVYILTESEPSTGLISVRAAKLKRFALKTEGLRMYVKIERMKLVQWKYDGVEKKTLKNKDGPANKVS